MSYKSSLSKGYDPNLILAMIADRVVLLPNTNVGRRAVMGSGALGRRGGGYEDGSTWIGNGNYLSKVGKINSNYWS